MKPPIDIREHIKNLEQKGLLVRVKRPSNKDNWRSGESPWFPPERKSRHQVCVNYFCDAAFGARMTLPYSQRS